MDFLVSGEERIISRRISKVLQKWSVSDTVNKSLFLCLFVITGKLTRLRLLRQLWSRWYYLPSAPRLCFKLGNILDVFPVLSPSVCDHWPVSVAAAPLSFSSSLCLDLLAASFLRPAVSLWVSDWIAAWQESEGSTQKHGSIDPLWISNTYIVSVFETIHPTEMDSPPPSVCLLTFSLILSGIYTRWNHVFIARTRGSDHTESLPPARFLS